jgi:hypothetical protein
MLPARALHAPCAPPALGAALGAPARRPAAPRRARRAAGPSPPRAGGAADAWLDLAAFVAAPSGGARSPYEELADRIGRDVYVDVMGWRLFLKDARVAGGASLATALANALGPALAGGGDAAGEVAATLRRAPVALGAGKVVVALADALPAGCVRDLERICEDFGRGR